MVGKYHVCTVVDDEKHICVTELGHHWFRWWVVARAAPSHHRNQCWLLINHVPRNRLQSKVTNFDWPKCIKIIVCNFAIILSKGRWVSEPIAHELLAFNHNAVICKHIIRRGSSEKGQSTVCICLDYRRIQFCFFLSLSVFCCRIELFNYSHKIRLQIIIMLIGSFWINAL